MHVYEYIHVCVCVYIYSFPGSSMVKNLTAMQCRDTVLIPGMGRYPGEGNGKSLQYSCLGIHKGREGWRATVHGVPKSQAWVKWLCMHAYTCIHQFSCSVVSNSLRPHGMQHARLPCLSPTCGGCSNSCPLSRWCHPTISTSSPSSPAFNLSQHLGLFQWVSSWHQVAKVLELQHQSLQWTFRNDFLEDWLIWSPCSPRDSQESSPTPQFKSINSWALSFVVQLSHPYMTTGKTIALTRWNFVRTCIYVCVWIYIYISTTQEKTLHMEITRWSTLKSYWLYSLQPKMKKLFRVSKNKTGSWLWLRLWTPYCKIKT